MAIRGISNAEREPYILKTDPAHPDNIKSAVEARRIGTEAAGVEWTSELAADTEKQERTMAGAPTTFYLGTLTQADRIELGDLTAVPTMNGKGSVTLDMRRNQRNGELVKRGLRGWDNMLNAKGKPVAFEEATYSRSNGTFGKGASDASLQLLDLDQIGELANAILERNGMKTDFEKNFEGRLPQPDAQPSETGVAKAAPTSNSENVVALSEPNHPATSS